MIIAYWIVAGLAAFVFLAAGIMKLARPKEALKSSGMAWVEDFSTPVVKLIGAAEVLGAIGLILPVLTGIAPIIAPIAATCLGVLMIGAVFVHLRRKENPGVQAGLAALALAAAVLGFLTVI